MFSINQKGTDVQRTEEGFHELPVAVELWDGMRTDGY